MAITDDVNDVKSLALFAPVSVVDEDDEEDEENGESDSNSSAPGRTASRSAAHHPNSVELVPLKHVGMDDNGGSLGASSSESLSSTAVTAITSSSSQQEDVRKARRLLYVSHLFAQFSEVAWQFCLALFLAACTQYRSMVLVSTYGFAVNLTVFLVAPATGRYIDAPSQSRLRTARRLIVCENLCVLVATASCYLLWVSSSVSADSYSVEQHAVDHNNDSSSSTIQDDYDDDDGDLNWFRSHLAHVPTDPLSVVALIVIHVMGAAAQVMDQAFLVAMERDWIVVLSRAAAAAAAPATTTHNNSRSEAPLSEEEGESADDDDDDDSNSNVETTFRRWLSETNVAMKQIDLSCKVAAPAVAGILIPLLSSTPPPSSSSSSSNAAGNNGQPQQRYYDFQWACLVIGALNVAALIVEFTCTTRVYRLIPALANKDTASFGEPTTTKPVVAKAQQRGDSDNDKNYPPQQQQRCLCWKAALPQGLYVYLQQASAWGGLGLAFLYTNSLTLQNGIMTTYLLYRGLTLEVVGVLRAVASAIGLLGTVVYHISAKHLSLEATGLWSVSYQLGCLTLTLLSLSIPSDALALTLLIGCVCLSRIGLWVYDIAVTQLQQQEVPDHIRGQVGGVQSSLNNGFNLISFLLGILFPNPNDFFIYVSAGVMSVGIATGLFLFGVFLPRR